MTLSGSIASAHWRVSVDTLPVSGGFVCTIRVSHGGANDAFEHQFKHFRTFGSEREAVLEGLREGMLWIENKHCKAFDV